MIPAIVVALFGFIFIALALWKPNSGRIFIGVFYLAMAFGVNLPLVILHPVLYPLAGSHSYLPIYRWFFGTVLPMATIPLVIALILVEAAIGITILSKGEQVRYGLLTAILFCLFITPLGVEEITAPLIAVGLAIILLNEMRNSTAEPILSDNQIRELS